MSKALGELLDDPRSKFIRELIDEASLDGTSYERVLHRRLASVLVEARRHDGGWRFIRRAWEEWEGPRPVEGVLGLVRRVAPPICNESAKYTSYRDNCSYTYVEVVHVDGPIGLVDATCGVSFLAPQ